MGKTDFGAVFEGSVSFSPSLKRTHFYNFTAETAISLCTSGNRPLIFFLFLDSEQREREKNLMKPQAAQQQRSGGKFSFLSGKGGILGRLSFGGPNFAVHHHQINSFLDVFKLGKNTDYSLKSSNKQHKLYMNFKIL